jgi:hypothetical protein
MASLLPDLPAVSSLSGSIAVSILFTRVLLLKWMRFELVDIYHREYRGHNKRQSV